MEAKSYDESIVNLSLSTGLFLLLYYFIDWKDLCSPILKFCDKFVISPEELSL